jgi:two-component system, cell cycle sensor histidine kinase and response regulator CckA
LLKIDPHVKAIASSGYSDDPVMAAPEKFGFKGKLNKPYLQHELIQAIENLSSE